MKNYIIGAVAAVIAVTSFASAASAEVVYKYRNNGYHNRHNTVVVVRPRARVYVAPRRVYIAPRVVIRADDCFTKKIRRVNNYGEVVVKRVRVCR